MRDQQPGLEKIAQLPTWRHEPLRTALAQRGEHGHTCGKSIACGAGWQVVDIVCTCGPADRSFEERHASQSVSLVLAGMFNYRSDHGRVLLSPGSVLLGNVGRPFECSHQHGAGDRCLSFQFEPALFAALAEDAGMAASPLGLHRLPPLRALSGLSWHSARLLAAPQPPTPADCEEVVLAWAGQALHLGSAGAPSPLRPVSLRDQARVATVLQFMQHSLDQPHTLDELAGYAHLSSFHFLRVFTRVTGLTPHQWLLQQRLAHAAQLLAGSAMPVTEVALAAGFADLSNFTRTFRAEYGKTPGEFARH